MVNARKCVFFNEVILTFFKTVEIKVKLAYFQNCITAASALP